MSSRPRRAATLGVKYNEDAAGGSSYPDGKPDSPFEKMVALLNGQAFPSARLAHLDDLVVYAMFATKARPKSYRAIKPDTMSDATMTVDEAGLFNGSVRLHVEKGTEPTFPKCQEAAKEVMSKLPHLFDEKSYKVLVHTILRYKLLYSPDSNVQLEKVKFGDGPISGGLRARSTIRAGAYLLYACGSLSSNRHKPGHATIEATTQQLGPTGSRMILGPLRFVNHDCNPNSQLYPIPNSHAFTIITLQQIEAGQSITVKYTEGGYWGECWCGSCKGYSTLMLPRHENTQVPNPNKKQRRGGKRKTISINGVHTRIANNRGRLNVAPELVPPSFTVPQQHRPVAGSSGPAAAADPSTLEEAEIEEGEIVEGEIIGVPAVSSDTPAAPPPPAEPTVAPPIAASAEIYDMPSPMSSIDESDSE
ncbi:hypothetical protein DFH07DRAFT_857787 [Mycena maculata]|uniref:SET domain-containing protein n=1 Tax=Mycena maculata TaxID=230809 RepID=A0AAD7HIL7_9AGAR|nr:hypothetical protein DFH07DRAFT_857787 [Mycena maculata]